MDMNFDKRIKLVHTSVLVGFWVISYLVCLRMVRIKTLQRNYISAIATKSM